MHFSSNIWHPRDFRNLGRKPREGENVVGMIRFGCFATLEYLELLSSAYAGLLLGFLSMVLSFQSPAQSSDTRP